MDGKHCFYVLAGILLLAVIAPPAGTALVISSNSSRTSQDFETEVKRLENFEMKNENLISRNDLPCEKDSKFKLQCASVRRAVRKWRQRSWMKGRTPQMSSQLFDEVHATFCFEPNTRIILFCRHIALRIQSISRSQALRHSKRIQSTFRTCTMQTEHIYAVSQGLTRCTWGIIMRSLHSQS